MTWAKQNRGRLIAAFAAFLGAGTVFGTLAIGAVRPVRFNPFLPTRTDTSLNTGSAGGDTPLPAPTPVPGPTRPPIRDPFRPPTRSPFTP